MQKVLMISGCKQSGKTSAMNYVAGYLLRANQIPIGVGAEPEPITYFELTDDGELTVNCPILEENGEVTREMVKLDITNRDPAFIEMADKVIFPFIRPYAFGDALKETACSLFGLSLDEVYGTDEDKNKLSPVTWESISKFVKRKKTERTDETYLTNREFLEIWGTDICRAINNNCWVDIVFNQIASENYPFCVVTDCRFENEVDYARAINGIELKVIRLTRQPGESSHSAENDLSSFTGFDAVVDNANLTQEEKGEKIIELLKSWGWLS